MAPKVEAGERWALLVVRDFSSAVAGENAFTFGLLYAREMAVATDAERRFAAETWPKLAAKKHRGWLH